MRTTPTMYYASMATNRWVAVVGHSKLCFVAQNGSQRDRNLENIHLRDLALSRPSSGRRSPYARTRLRWRANRCNLPPDHPGVPGTGLLVLCMEALNYSAGQASQGASEFAIKRHPSRYRRPCPDLATVYSVARFLHHARLFKADRLSWPGFCRGLVETRQHRAPGYWTEII